MWPLAADQRRRFALMLARVKRKGAGRLRGARTLEQLVADGLELGEGASVAPGAYVDPNRPWLITIGDESIISDFATITAHGPR